MKSPTLLFSMQQLFYLQIDLKSHSCGFRKYFFSMLFYEYNTLGVFSLYYSLCWYLTLVSMKFVLVSLPVILTILNKIFG